jgi:hypothetical protein
MSEIEKRERTPRWATRLEAMSYARVGSTTMNDWLQNRRIVAKKLGAHVRVDLNSIDDLFNALPDVGETTAA